MPARRKISVRRGNVLPLTIALSVPQMAIGSMAAPEWRSKNPAPGSALCIPGTWDRVPSTKISRRPCFRISMAVFSARRSAVPRSTGKQLHPASIQLTKRLANSSFFAMANNVPGKKAPKTSGSNALRWFETTRTPVSAGIRSNPSTWIFEPKKARKAVLKNRHTMRYRQERFV